MDAIGKITTNDFMIRVLPGGFFLSVLFFGFHLEEKLEFVSGLDFLYTFLFLCMAFIVGELLQTLAHLLEFFIDIFFKGYRPSEIFLLKNNPIIEEDVRKKVLQKLSIDEESEKYLNFEYENVPWICKKNDKGREYRQGFFWRIFSEVESVDSIQRSNINYLFLRVITIEFLLLIFVMAFVDTKLMIVFLGIFLCLLWRTRGVSKGLIFKSINVFLKSSL